MECTSAAGSTASDEQMGPVWIRMRRPRASGSNAARPARTFVVTGTESVGFACWSIDSVDIRPRKNDELQGDAEVGFAL
jgi:hypothetical protein